MKIRFVIQDFWIGIFWKTNQYISPDYRKITTFYICIIPCFPIIFDWKHKITSTVPCDHEFDAPDLSCAYCHKTAKQLGIYNLEDDYN